MVTQGSLWNLGELALAILQKIILQRAIAMYANSINYLIVPSVSRSKHLQHHRLTIAAMVFLVLCRNA